MRYLCSFEGPPHQELSALKWGETLDPHCQATTEVMRGNISNGTDGNSVPYDRVRMHSLSLTRRQHHTKPNGGTFNERNASENLFKKIMNQRLRNCSRPKQTKDVTTKCNWSSAWVLVLWRYYQVSWQNLKEACSEVEECILLPCCKGYGVVRWAVSLVKIVINMFKVEAFRLAACRWLFSGQIFATHPPSPRSWGWELNTSGWCLGPLPHGWQTASSW